MGSTSLGSCDLRAAVGLAAWDLKLLAKNSETNGVRAKQKKTLTMNNKVDTKAEQKTRNKTTRRDAKPRKKIAQKHKYDKVTGQRRSQLRDELDGESVQLPVRFLNGVFEHVVVIGIPFS
jgi:hypothetical protein